MTADRFYIDTTTNAQGGYLHVDRLHLDLRDVKVTSLTARSAEANLVTGTLALSYKELSGVVTRLAGNGGPLQVSQTPGSNGQAARIKVAGTVGGTALNATGTLLAQGTELSLTVPGVERNRIGLAGRSPGGCRLRSGALHRGRRRDQPRRSPGDARVVALRGLKRPLPTHR